MRSTSTDEVIRVLTHLFHQVKSNKHVIDPEFQLNWILKNRQQSAIFNGQSVANLWFILLNLDYGCQRRKQAKEIPKEILHELINATIEKADSLKSNELMHILNGLVAMRIWRLADANFTSCRSALLSAIEKHFSGLDFPKTTLNMANLGIQWKSFPDKLKNHFSSKILSHLDLLTTEALENTSLFDYGRQLVDLLWSCAILGAPTEAVSQTHTILLLAIIKIIERDTRIMLENPERSMTERSPWLNAVSELQKIQQVRFYFKLKLPSHIEDSLNAALKKYRAEQERHPLTFQSSVTRLVGNFAKIYGFTYETEASPLELKPVDIYFPENRVILEINGPLHYNVAGEPRPQDILNKRLFEMYEFSVIYLKQSDWINASSHPDKQALVFNTLEKANLIPAPKKEIKTTDSLPNAMTSSPPSSLTIATLEMKEENFKAATKSSRARLFAPNEKLFKPKNKESTIDFILNVAIKDKVNNVNPDELGKVRKIIADFLFLNNITTKEYATIKKILIQSVKKALYAKNMVQLINPFNKCFTYGFYLNEYTHPEFALTTDNLNAAIASVIPRFQLQRTSPRCLQ